MVSAEQDVSDRDYVNSLARGLEVISAFTRTRPKMTLSEISRATGMTRATVRRFLLTLVREGYAEKDDKLFSLKPKVLELGYSALSSMGILDVIQPVMNDLSRELQESVFAAVLTGDYVTYIARATSERLVNVSITIGSTTPAHAVSTGRVLLAAEPNDALERYIDRVKLEPITPHTVTSKVKLRAEIEKVRLEGYSFVDQELEIGLGSLSVPVRNREGRVLAALNVCCPTARVTSEDMRKNILPELIAASQTVTRGM
ncbi:ArsR family transcriptional regulator [Sphingomonas sp. ABOLG]|jgi:IclR family pca regulon transcriptional regulator|uniref:ArsR family transcriptional regulator n=1 Tax=Sphingomonas olei TaxID=1886787 RepID=A0ABY2QHS6_9SPHN|nr:MULTISPECIES: IclR family transcriptional regulator C-terminal domain-containing protein [Sphingomonas]MDF2602781.1 IclR family transcriptional regulator [Sphingomonas sp.]RSV19450.1 ArsR family transcriptional regulator [Sphingomonas sp. ABOLG]THG40257.1 ArsR family transcriptional regulator [Sphingomonas olei]